MKLGKALATGVAHERPQDRDEQLQVPEENADIARIGKVETAEAPAREEVPVAR
ncbi:hypothetical protein ACFYNL_37260 [Streptomyces sp. NPDC007808]|uniref:hypothetical protein n=1 Tax=Streptomyces sp. NPDC007808 TaxID=3364779 RepID=UPI00368CF828